MSAAAAGNASGGLFLVVSLRASRLTKVVLENSVLEDTLKWPLIVSVISSIINY